MTLNYYSYKNTSLSKILRTTNSSSTYYGSNMSLEDASMNPLSAAFPFGYNLPTSIFPTSSTNSYREAFYIDYTTSDQTVTAPTGSGATHFSAILIGQGGAGGGGGGGYYIVADGAKPYYSGGHGTNGTAGTARVLENIAFDNSIQISVGSDNSTNNKGTTGARNRNVSNVFGTSGTSGEDGSATTLTYNTTGSTTSTIITADGGTGGAGGLATAFVWHTSLNTITAPTTSFEPFNNEGGYTPIGVNSATGSGGLGGNGGYGTAGSQYGNPTTTELPKNGASGSPGLCRIYWKREF